MLAVGICKPGSRPLEKTAPFTTAIHMVCVQSDWLTSCCSISHACVAKCSARCHDAVVSVCIPVQLFHRYLVVFSSPASRAQCLTQIFMKYCYRIARRRWLAGRLVLNLVKTVSRPRWTFGGVGGNQRCHLSEHVALIHPCRLSPSGGCKPTGAKRPKAPSWQPLPQAPCSNPLSARLFKAAPRGLRSVVSQFVYLLLPKCSAECVARSRRSRKIRTRHMA